MGCGRAKSLARLEFLHANFLGDVDKFVWAQLFHLLSAVGEALAKLDGRFLHSLVGLVGAAQEQKALAAGDPLVTVVAVETDAE